MEEGSGGSNSGGSSTKSTLKRIFNTCLPKIPTSKARKAFLASHPPVDDPTPEFVDMDSVENWRTVEDARGHIVEDMCLPSTSSGRKFTFSGTPIIVGNIYRQKICRNERVRRFVDQSTFRFFCLMGELKHDQQLVMALVERWWDTTHTFHFVSAEVGFTPYDLTAITGVPVGLGDPPRFEHERWGYTPDAGTSSQIIERTDWFDLDHL